MHLQPSHGIDGPLCVTFGLVTISMLSTSLLNEGGILLMMRWSRNSWAPWNMRPPPTTRMELYILRLVSSEAAKRTDHVVLHSQPKVYLKFQQHCNYSKISPLESSVCLMSRSDFTHPTEGIWSYHSSRCCAGWLYPGPVLCFQIDSWLQSSWRSE